MFPSNEAAAWYLAGLFDGEGHISKRAIKGKARGFTRDARITNTDPDLLDAAEAALTRLGIAFTRHDRSERDRLGTKPIFDIIVSHKDNLDLLLDLIPMQTSKLESLKESVGSYVRKNRPPEEDLRKLVEGGWSDAVIGETYGVTGGAVWFWRRHYGIERKS